MLAKLNCAVKILWCSALMAGMTVQTARAENLVKNGSFEIALSPTVPPPGMGTGVQQHNVFMWAGVADWNDSYIHDTLYTAQFDTSAVSPDGGNYFNSSIPPDSGVLSQTIGGLMVGAKYNLAFYQALGDGAVVGENPSGGWSVSLGDQTQLSDTIPGSAVTLPFGALRQIISFSGWRKESLTFTATQTSELLTFVAFGTGSRSSVFLDGVSLTLASPTVPEPATYAMILLGLIGVGYVARRKFALENRHIGSSC